MPHNEKLSIFILPYKSLVEYLEILDLSQLKNYHYFLNVDIIVHQCQHCRLEARPSGVPNCVMTLNALPPRLANNKPVNFLIIAGRLMIASPKIMQ